MTEQCDCLWPADSFIKPRSQCVEPSGHEGPHLSEWFDITNTDGTPGRARLYAPSDTPTRPLP